MTRTWTKYQALAEDDAGRAADAEGVSTIIPEDRISNVIESLIRHTHGSAYPQRMENIRQIANQLDEYWQKYQAGDLEEISDELPF